MDLRESCTFAKQFVRKTYFRKRKTPSRRTKCALSPGAFACYRKFCFRPVALDDFWGPVVWTLAKNSHRRLTWFQKIRHDNPSIKRFALVDSGLPSKNVRFQTRCSVAHTCSVIVLNVNMGYYGTCIHHPWKAEGLPQSQNDCQVAQRPLRAL